MSTLQIYKQLILNVLKIASQHKFPACMNVIKINILNTPSQAEHKPNLSLAIKHIVNYWTKQNKLLAHLLLFLVDFWRLDIHLNNLAKCY